MVITGVPRKFSLDSLMSTSAVNGGSRLTSQNISQSVSSSVWSAVAVALQGFRIKGFSALHGGARD